MTLELLPDAAASKSSDRAPDSARTLTVESFAAIRAERTRWLWANRIPLGAVSLLVGREKLGKSTLTVELAAQLSRGELAGDLFGQPSRSMIVSYEDSAASTIKPRLLAAGANVELVERLKADQNGIPDLVSLPGDVERIAELARARGVRLFVVDPFSASLGAGIDSHRDHDMRRALAPLAQLAENADLSVVAVAHWNKSQGGDPLSRVLGSRGLTAAVRSVLAFGRRADADDRSPDRVLAHAACNVGREARSLSCRIEPAWIEGDGERLETSRLALGDEVDVTAAELLAVRSDDDRTEADAAAEWLADQLADGEWHKSAELKQRAKAAEISDKPLRRAREQLGVEDRREGYPAVSEWRLAVVPPTDETRGHDWTGHDWQTPIATGDSQGPGAQSCPLPIGGTTEAKTADGDNGRTLADVTDAEWLAAFPGSVFLDTGEPLPGLPHG